VNLQRKMKDTLTVMGVIAAALAAIAGFFGPPILIIWVILHFILKFW
jgi:hypothetical protein